MLRVGEREQYYYRMLHVEVLCVCVCGDFQCVGANGGGYALCREERTILL